MGMIINRRRVMGGKSNKEPININVKTHSIGGFDASLDVITGDGETVNILYQTAMKTPWTNGYIQVKYNASKYNWEIYAATPCLYDGQVYNVGDLITNWEYTVTKDIDIVVNI